MAVDLLSSLVKTAVKDSIKNQSLAATALASQSEARAQQIFNKIARRTATGSARRTQELASGQERDFDPGSRVKQGLSRLADKGLYVVAPEAAHTLQNFRQMQSVVRAIKTIAHAENPLTVAMGLRSLISAHQGLYGRYTAARQRDHGSDFRPLRYTASDEMLWRASQINKGFLDRGSLFDLAAKLPREHQAEFIADMEKRLERLHNACLLYRTDSGRYQVTTFFYEKHVQYQRSKATDGNLPLPQYNVGMDTQLMKRMDECGKAGELFYAWGERERLMKESDTHYADMGATDRANKRAEVSNEFNTSLMRLQKANFVDACDGYFRLTDQGRERLSTAAAEPQMREVALYNIDRKIMQKISDNAAFDPVAERQSLIGAAPAEKAEKIERAFDRSMAKLTRIGLIQIRNDQFLLTELGREKLNALNEVNRLRDLKDFKLGAWDRKNILKPLAAGDRHLVELEGEIRQRYPEEKEADRQWFMLRRRIDKCVAAGYLTCENNRVGLSDFGRVALNTAGDAAFQLGAWDRKNILEPLTAGRLHLTEFEVQLRQRYPDEAEAERQWSMLRRRIDECAAAGYVILDGRFVELAERERADREPVRTKDARTALRIDTWDRANVLKPLAASDLHLVELEGQIRQRYPEEAEADRQWFMLRQRIDECAAAGYLTCKDNIVALTERGRTALNTASDAAFQPDAWDRKNILEPLAAGRLHLTEFEVQLRQRYPDEAEAERQWSMLRRRIDECAAAGYVTLDVRFVELAERGFQSMVPKQVEEVKTRKPFEFSKYDAQQIMPLLKEPINRFDLYRLFEKKYPNQATLERQWTIFERRLYKNIAAGMVKRSEYGRFSISARGYEALESFRNNSQSVQAKPAADDTKTLIISKQDARIMQYTREGVFSALNYRQLRRQEDPELENDLIDHELLIISRRLIQLQKVGLAERTGPFTVQCSDFLADRSRVALERSRKPKEIALSREQDELIRSLGVFANVTREQALQHIYGGRVPLFELDLADLKRRDLIDTVIIPVKNYGEQQVLGLSKFGRQVAGYRIGDDQILTESKVNTRPAEMAHDLLIFDAYQDAKERLAAAGKDVAIVYSDRQSKSIDMREQGRQEEAYADLKIVYKDRQTGEIGTLNLEVAVNYKDHEISKKSSIANCLWYTPGAAQASRIRRVLPGAQVVQFA